MSWLAVPPVEAVAAVPGDLPALPASPEDHVVAAVRPGECGEPLVPIPEDLPRYPVYERMPFAVPVPPPRLRTGVVDRLRRARSLLSAPFDLVVIQGWRTPEFQAELTRYYAAAGVEDLAGYVAPAGDEQVMAPHVTGGAVDLTLSWHGTPLALGSDFDAFEPAAHLRGAEDADEDDTERRGVRDLRRLLGHVMLESGFAPYPLEWWHWSYGDQRWAAFVGCAATEYSPVSGPVPPEHRAG